MQGNKHQCYVNFDYVRYRGNGKGDVFTLISCSFLHITFAHSVSTGVFFPRFEMHSGLAYRVQHLAGARHAGVCASALCMRVWVHGCVAIHVHLHIRVLLHADSCAPACVLHVRLCMCMSARMRGSMHASHCICMHVQAHAHMCVGVLAARGLNCPGLLSNAPPSVTTARSGTSSRAGGTL